MGTRDLLLDYSQARPSADHPSHCSSEVVDHLFNESGLCVRKPYPRWLGGSNRLIANMDCGGDSDGIGWTVYMLLEIFYWVG